MQTCCNVRTRYRAATTMTFLVAMAMALPATATTARADIHDSLVVHLRFDGDVVDYSGRGNDGAIVRTGTDSPYVAGIIGQAFQTKGSVTAPDTPTGNYITLGNPDDLNLGTSTDLSISWWGQYTADAQHDDIPWLSNKDWLSGSSIGWVLASEGGGTLKWNWRARAENRHDSPHVGGGLDDGQWHHYVVTFTRGPGGTGTIYLDGVAVDTSPLASSGNINAQHFILPTNILQDGFGDYTDGDGGANWDNALIDDLGIWRRAITDAEVALIYTMGLQGISALD